MAARRGQNEGSIFQRSRDGRWVAAITLPDGKRRERIAKTKREAQQKLRELEERAGQGLELDASQTVAQFLDRWLADVARESVRPSTFESYASIVRVRVVPHIGRIRLDKITGQQIQGLYSRLRGAGLSPGSIRRTHAVLHRAFRYAVRWRLILRNPVDDATAPRVPKAEMQTLSPEQVMQLIDAAPDPATRALFALACTAGLRRGELLGLRWSDVDLSRRVLSVARSAQRIDASGWVFVEPKTKSGRRLVRLADMTIRELELHRVAQVTHRLQIGPLWKDLDLVFASEVGTPIEEAVLSRRFKRSLQKAGLPPMRFHDQRHTAATIMMSLGVHPKMVQETLGHSNISITLDTYSHVTPDMQDAAVAALNARYAAS